MSQHYTGFGRRSSVTPQSQPLPGSTQTLNSTGVGYSWQTDDLARFKRFLCIGAATSTYYVGQRDLVRGNLEALDNLLRAGRGLEALALLVDVSQAGRAPSNDPALFALARLIGSDVHPKVPMPVPTERVYHLHRAHHPDLFAELDAASQEAAVAFQTHVRKGRITRFAFAEGDRDTIIKTVSRTAHTASELHPDDLLIRREAARVLWKVARTGTHWLHYQAFKPQFRGRGRIDARANKAWYTRKPPTKLAYQLLKYQRRDRWSQGDVLRLVRPKPESAEQNALFRWATHGWEASEQEKSGEHVRAIPAEEALKQIWAFEVAKTAAEPNTVADLITTYGLPREAVPTEMLREPAVWRALLAGMPPEAMLRNLAQMTRKGVLVPLGDLTALVVERLTDPEAVRAARLHPLKVLSALKTYARGSSPTSGHTWTPLQEIVDALGVAFTLGFKSVEPSGCRVLLAIDTSGSMWSSFVNENLDRQEEARRTRERAGTVASRARAARRRRPETTHPTPSSAEKEKETRHFENPFPQVSCAEAASAMAMVLAASEWRETESGLRVPQYHVIGFDTRVSPLSISPAQRLDDVLHTLRQLREPNGTDCSLPFQYAAQHHLDVDAVIQLTDAESWSGHIHAAQSLQNYRQQVGHPVKFVEVAMTATAVTNIDPDDQDSLGVVGFDTEAPAIIAQFLAGQF